MKLHNPFTAKDSAIVDMAYSSVISVIVLFTTYLIVKFGFLLAMHILCYIAIATLVLTCFYVTIKYIFTGK
jgi:hypothetical protein